jgi:chromosome segregation ATPase
MKKTIALVAASLVALAVVAKVSGVGSYATTLWQQAKTTLKDSVPTKFDIDRIRHEIASLDQDLDRMITPIAQHTVAVKRLQDEVSQVEKNLAEQKKVLLDATALVKSGKDPLCYGGKCYSNALVKQKIADDFKTYQNREKYLTARKSELTAKEATLRATQEQLQSFVSKKKEFEVILAQLEAEHEINLVAAIGTEIKIDDTRAAQIARDLDELKTKIEAQGLAMSMKRDVGALNGLRLDQPTSAPGVDLEAIQAHLEGKTEVKTASSK